MKKQKLGHTMHTTFLHGWRKIFLIAVICLLKPMVSFADVQLPNGYLYFNIDDMKVKTVAGDFTVTRTWYKDNWSFNRELDNIQIIIQTLALSSGGSVSGFVSARSSISPIHSIRKNNKSYFNKVSAPDVFIHDEKNQIKVLESGGYRWENVKSGDWIEYNDQGRPVKFGDRNNAGMTIQYDTANRINGILDQNGSQIIWYEYGLAGGQKITAIHDSTTPEPRKVEYIYTDQLLTSVKDVEGNIWNYEYGQIVHYEKASSSSSLSTNMNASRSASKRVASRGAGTTSTFAPNSGRKIIKNVLNKLIDPDGRPTNIDHYHTGRVKSEKKADGTGPVYSYEYDKSSKEYYVKITHSSGKIDENWYDKDAELIRQDINGQTVMTMRRDGRKRIFTDSVGNVTVKEYDQWDNLVKVTNPDRSVKTYVIDPDLSVVLEETNERGVITKNEYDDKGNLTRKTEAFGLPEERVTEYAYDAFGRLTIERSVGDINTTMAETIYTYDANGNIDALTEPEGNVTDFLLYDTMGNALQWLDGRGKLWKQSFDGMGRLISKTNPLNHVTSYQYDGAGNLTHETDAESNTTQIQYDNSGRVKTILDALTNSATIDYNLIGQLKSITDQEGKKVYLSYDDKGRIESTIDGAGNTIENLYELPGSNADYQLIAGINYPTYTEIYEFDALGRKIKSTRQTAGNGNFITQYGYDIADNLTSLTDAENRAIRIEYDALNRIKTVINPLNNTVEYSYDDRDNLLSVTNENNVVIRRYAYDRNNRKTSETWPAGQTWSYDYDASGNLIKSVDGKGQVTRHRYDDAGRRDQSQYFTDTLQTIPTKTVSFGYDNRGNITSYNDGSISGTIAFDALARKTGETVNYGPFSKGYSYEMYKNGKTRQFIDAELQVTEYGYDAANRLSTVKLPGSDGTVVFSDYLWQQPRQISYPGGSSRKLQYDDLLRLTDIKVSDPAGNTVMDYQYSYDRVNNILDKLTEHGAYQYDYDNLDRLTSAINPTLADESYQYDPAGNRTQSADVAGLWVYNDANQLLNFGATSQNYDDNGNTIFKSDGSTVQVLEYNLENRLNRVIDSITNTEIASYHYDPFGRRVWKDVSGVRTYFQYAEEGLIAEFDGVGSVIRSYQYQPNTMWGTSPLVLNEAGNKGFYQLDHLGTPQKLVGNTGVVLWSGDINAFGAVSIKLNVVNNHLRFPGHIYDEETNNSYNYFRYFNTDIGRYVQSDPVGLVGGLQSYSYVLNNPNFWLDPYGLWCIGPNATRAIAGAFGGGVTGFLAGGGNPLTILGGAVVGASAGYFASSLGGGERASGIVGGIAGGLNGGGKGGIIGGAFGGIGSSSSGSSAAGGALGGFIGGAFAKSKQIGNGWRGSIGANMLKGGAHGLIGGLVEDGMYAFLDGLQDCDKKKCHK